MLKYDFILPLRENSMEKFQTSKLVRIQKLITLLARLLLRLHQRSAQLLLLQQRMEKFQMSKLVRIQKLITLLARLLLRLQQRSEVLGRYLS
jgi:hypothetical protein